MFGHRSKLEEGGSPHPDNLESLAPSKGLASCQAARLSAADKGPAPKEGLRGLSGTVGGSGGGVIQGKEQKLLSNKY